MALPTLEWMAGTGISLNVLPALREVFGAAALIGLFAMHGLAAHGTSHQEHLGEPMVLVAADHDGPLMAPTHAGEELQVGDTPGVPTPDPGLLGLAGLCLAVLLAGLVVAVLLGRRVAAHGHRDRCPRGGGWPTRSRRDRDPPCLLALSIQRC
jgi:hypothetical protein